MNDLGHVVFNYQLADFRTGIAVAIPVPEPTVAIGFIALGLAIRLERVPRPQR
jgi:hypothetical protein